MGRWRSHGGRKEGGWQHAWEGVVGGEVRVWGDWWVASWQKGGCCHHLGLGRSQGKRGTRRVSTKWIGARGRG